MPRLLTPDQKPIKLILSQANLAIFETDHARFFPNQDEYWVHHFEPESKRKKRQSMPWKHHGPPKKAKVVSSSGKMMASVFWDAKGNGS